MIITIMIIKQPTFMSTIKVIMTTQPTIEILFLRNRQLKTHEVRANNYVLKFHKQQQQRGLFHLLEVCVSIKHLWLHISVLLNQSITSSLDQLIT